MRPKRLGGCPWQVVGDTKGGHERAVGTLEYYGFRIGVTFPLRLASRSVSLRCSVHLPTGRPQILNALDTSFDGLTPVTTTEVTFDQLRGSFRGVCLAVTASGERTTPFESGPRRRHFPRTGRRQCHSIVVPGKVAVHGGKGL